MKTLAYLILGAIVGLSAAAPGWSEAPEMGCTLPAAPQKEPVMSVEELNTVADATIPPIDRAVPKVFETAAFGLG